jgi:hypothetical protein
MSTYNDALDLARQTPLTRNRYVDLLRAVSIFVVVLGHWLMAAPQVVDFRTTSFCRQTTGPTI